MAWSRPTDAVVWCPLTWSKPVPPMTLHWCALVEDELPAAPTPWHLVLDKLALAHGLFAHGCVRQARTAIADAYVRLLPSSDHGCGLIRDYRPALRHALDGMWAMMAWTPERDERLADFVARIEPLHRMDMSQDTAFNAIYAHLASKEGDVQHVLRGMVLGQPTEGEWHSMLGEYLRKERKEQHEPPGASELFHLREAHRLRPGPHTRVRLARSLADVGVDGSGTAKQRDAARTEALALLDDAFRLYPRHPFVLAQSAFHLLRLRGRSDAAFAEARRLLERAREAVGGDRAYLRLKLAYLCRQQGREQEALHHFTMACQMNPPCAGTFDCLFVETAEVLPRV